MLSFEKIKRNQLLKIFAMFILSDGYMHYNAYKNPGSIRLTTLGISSKNQHDYFSKLCYLLFEKRPLFNIKSMKTRYCNSYKKFLFSELYLQSACYEMLKLSQIYKTTPGRNMSKEEYLSSLQPTISFLFNEPIDIKWLAIRVLFDFDGSIVTSFRLKRKTDIRNKKNYIYYQIFFHCEIRFAETNPNLTKELLNLFKLMGMKAMILKDKRNWIGIGGVQLYRREDVIKFLEFGGALSNVKISSKSKKFKGFKKQSVCSAAKELLKSNIKLSHYFKNKEDAEKKCELLNKNFMEFIKKYESPVV